MWIERHDYRQEALQSIRKKSTIWITRMIVARIILIPLFFGLLGWFLTNYTWTEYPRSTMFLAALLFLTGTVTALYSCITISNSHEYIKKRIGWPAKVRDKLEDDLTHRRKVLKITSALANLPFEARIETYDLIIRELQARLPKEQKATATI